MGLAKTDVDENNTVLRFGKRSINRIFISKYAIFLPWKADELLLGLNFDAHSRLL